MSVKAKIKYLIFTSVMLVSYTVGAQDTKMVSIKEGSYIPLYGSADKKPVQVAAFKMDIYPVTNAQFVTFLKENPTYDRSRIIGLYADKSYLSAWKSDHDFSPLKSNAPVTNVSWFAAKKYCECQGKRLPTMDEWEYAAMADQTRKDARTKEQFNKYILEWYEKPKTYLNPVGQTYKNYWGLYDMHGLVWEWTSDFNSIFLSGESRKDKGSDKDLFCGSASINASDLMDYAAFMRFAFRGSLKANYSTRNLGFRCASN